MKKVLWALFGNDEDGIYGTADFLPTCPQWCRAVAWWLRNPAHNLCFHVIRRLPVRCFLAGWRLESVLADRRERAPLPVCKLHRTHQVLHRLA